MISRPAIPRLVALAAVLAVLLAAYLPTLQTIPNGSDHYYMIDVGETQVVLNLWGTLHPTGYPHYTVASSAVVAILKAFGVSPAAAPALASLLWGALSLGVLYALLLYVTGHILPAAAATLLFGVTRTVWIHHAIAEIYTFGLLLLVALLALALWQPPIRGRVYSLALLGGIAVAHHRALAMVAPALVFAVWDDLRAYGRRLPRLLVGCVLLGLIGFLPYVYLPLREWAGAAWVYGEPGTWAGFWDQFWGREAARFIGVPQSLDALLANIALVNTVLITDLTLPGLLAGFVGLAFGVYRRATRRAALTFLLSGIVAYLFHVALYTDVLSALILPVTLSIAAGWALLLASLVRLPLRLVLGIGIAGAGVLAAALYTQNAPFIDGLTEDRTGLETIAVARETPPGSTLMMAWGHRHFAVGFAKDVLGEMPEIRLVDHKADFAALARRGALVTPEYTFYNQPVAWWEERLGGRVYLRAAAPYLVEISTSPERAEAITELAAQDAFIRCTGERIVLGVTWAAPETPDEDRSVFVHLLDAGGALLAQADQSAPVYGWRPLTTWEPNEAVRDIYPLPRVPGAASIRYGLYHQTPNGAFQNDLEYTIAVDCDA